MAKTTSTAASGKAKPNNEVVKAAQAALPSTEVNQAWGSEGLDSSDMIIPKMLLMQGLSKKVASGEAMVGQIRDSLQNALLGGRVNPKENPKPVEIIIFSTFKTWILTEKKGDKFEYVSTVPYTADNADLERKGVDSIKGVEFENNLSLNYYVLTTKDIAEGNVFPYVVSFRRTSAKAGRELATYLRMMAKAGKPTAANVFNLNMEAMKNDKGEFFGFTIEKGRETTKQELTLAKEWYDLVQKNASSIKVDDSDLKSEATEHGTRAAATSDEY